MAPVRATRASARNDPQFSHCSLTPSKKRKVKRRKSFFNLTGQETHIAGVTRCQRTMTETTAELNELKYDMEKELSNIGYTDPNRLPLKAFVTSVEDFLKQHISGGFNKLVLTALYPPDGTDPPTIPLLENAWGEVLPHIAEMKQEHTRLCKIRDNNWVLPDQVPEKAKKTAKKGAKRRGRKKNVEDKEN